MFTLPELRGTIGAEQENRRLETRFATSVAYRSPRAASDNCFNRMRGTKDLTTEICFLKLRDIIDLNIFFLISN